MNVIDLFAGAGGFSTGATMAGCNVAWAANHWPDAVEWHSRNHPDAAHICQDLHQADWSQVPAHDLMLAARLPGQWYQLPSITGRQPSSWRTYPSSSIGSSTALGCWPCRRWAMPSARMW